MHRLFVFMAMICFLAAGSAGAAMFRSADTHPTDVAKSHLEEITAGPHVYKVAIRQKLP